MDILAFPSMNTHHFFILISSTLLWAWCLCAKNDQVMARLTNVDSWFSIFCFILVSRILLKVEEQLQGKTSGIL